MLSESFLRLLRPIPTLKANTNFLELQRELADVENKNCGGPAFLQQCRSRIQHDHPANPRQFHCAARPIFTAKDYFEIPEASRAEIEAAPAGFLLIDAVAEMRRSTAEARLAVREDAALIASILAEAFRADPVMSWIYGGEGPDASFFEIFARSLYLKHGFGHVIGEDAATLWLRSGVAPALTIGARARLGFGIWRHGGFSAVDRASTTNDILRAAQPSDPHYYLFAIGVRMNAQGRGLGGKLLRAGLSLADEDRALAYLENSNPRNTPLYESVGFRAVSPLPLPQGAPPLLGMARAKAEGAQ